MEGQVAQGVYYPRLVKRVRAVLIDSVVVPVIAVATLIAGHALGVTEFFGRVLLVAVPVFILEPGLVAFTGGTIGHHLVGLRVRRLSGAGNIDIFAATIRAVVKFALGWLSFIFVLTTERHQAIHDLVAGSIVVHRATTGLPQYDVLSERKVESEGFVYPSKWRRALVSFGYWIAMTLLLLTIAGAVATAICPDRLNCPYDRTLGAIFEIIWLVATGAIVVLGWYGRLPGARRRVKAPE